MRLDDLFPYWENVRETIKDAVRWLAPEFLDASPAQEVGSIGSLLRDMIHQEDYWIGQVVRGEGTVREADYSRRELPTSDAIIRMMDAVRARTEKLLEAMPASELERHFAAPDGQTMSLLSILWILFMNELHCRGQIFMLLRWLGLEPVEV